MRTLLCDEQDIRQRVSGLVHATVLAGLDDEDVFLVGAEDSSDGAGLITRWSAQFEDDVGYAISPTGAEHNTNLHDTLFAGPGWNMDRAKAWGVYEPMEAEDLSARKIYLLKCQTNLRWAQNSLGMCTFLPWSLHDFSDIVAAVTGWNYSTFELMQLGHRVATLARLFNTREGFTAAADTLPDKIFKPFKDGPQAGMAYPRDEWEQGKRSFYRMMGWEDHGVPTVEGLAELGLSDYEGILTGDMAPVQ